MRPLLAALILAASLLAAPPRPRVLVSTDIGGTDPDDFQSMVHFLLAADVFDVEGIVSSPYGPGRLAHIHQVLDLYAKDFPQLKSHSALYPTPEALRSLSKQGALDDPGPAGFAQPTDGSRWIIQCARRPDPRPLYVLVWGGIEDLAQALHDDPSIGPKLRVYFIGGPNKMWSANAYNYIETHHPKLWIIEANSTYRGFFVGGNQAGPWSNSSFVSTHVAGRGHMADFFTSLLKGTIKMGDTPSVTWLLHGDPANPRAPSWGGAFVPVWDNRKTVFTRLTTAADTAEAFGIVEFAFPLPKDWSPSNSATMLFDNRIKAAGHVQNKTIHFRFSPRDRKLWPYRIESNHAALNAQSGSFTAAAPTQTAPSRIHPNWFIDDPNPTNREGVHDGAKTVNIHREAVLRDFSTRLQRATPPPSKLRVAVLTDIENEPDDAMSMVRFLTYSNLWDVEALIATTSIHQRNRTAPEKIHEILDAYAQVRDNLNLHEPGYPTAAYLKSITLAGRAAYGMTAVGPNMDSPASEKLIELIDRPDPRPLYVTVWGGPNCLAQALHKIRATRSPEDLDTAVAKLRVYTISDQDDSGPWLRKTFPNLFYIASPGFSDGGAYHHATWSGISGDKFHGRFIGADFSIVDNPWLDKNVRAKGPLGRLYPQVKFLMEGDTPSFFYLIPNGLGHPEHPNWGSWGGRYELYTPRMQKWFSEPETRPFWSDAEDEAQALDGNWTSSNKATIWRWRSAYQNDFAARMDWTILPFDKANHPPVPRLAHPDRLTAKSGQPIQLSAQGSSDPDSNPLTYRWIPYPEAGTYAGNRLLTIQNNTQIDATLTAPRVAKPETLHIVLAVTDTGAPPLTRYKRIIVTIYP